MSPTDLLLLSAATVIASIIMLVAMVGSIERWRAQRRNWLREEEQRKTGRKTT
jgi:hypothetical protein